MLAKSGQKTALAGDWPKAIASQGWLNEGRRRGDIASASPAPMTDIANILRRNGQFSSGTSLHSVKQAPACWGLRPQSPKREASADKATAAPHVAAALCQAQGWLPRISPILNVPSPADWRNLDATAVLIARPSPKLPRGPETLSGWAPAKQVCKLSTMHCAHPASCTAGIGCPRLRVCPALGPRTGLWAGSGGRKVRSQTRAIASASRCQIAAQASRALAAAAEVAAAPGALPSLPVASRVCPPAQPRLRSDGRRSWQQRAAPASGARP